MVCNLVRSRGIPVRGDWRIRRVGRSSGWERSRAAAILRALAPPARRAQPRADCQRGSRPIHGAAYRRRAGDGEFHNDGGSTTPTRPVRRLVPQANRHFRSDPIIALLPVAEIITRLLQCRERIKDRGAVVRRATTDRVRSATIACNIARTALVDHASSRFDWRWSRDRVRWIASRSMSGDACSMEGTSC